MTQKERYKKWHDAHPGVANARAKEAYWKDHDRLSNIRRENSLERRKRVRLLLDKFKDVPCAACGVKFPSCCMDFHHRNPIDKHPVMRRKSSNVGMTSFGYAVKLEVLLDEIAKCDVICANCHRIHHAQKTNQ